MQIYILISPIIHNYTHIYTGPYIHSNWKGKDSIGDDFEKFSMDIESFAEKVKKKKKKKTKKKIIKTILVKVMKVILMQQLILKKNKKN